MLVSDAGVLALSLAHDGAIGQRARATLIRVARVVIPALADIETVSVLRKWWLAGTIDLSRFELAVKELGSSPYHRRDMRPLLARVLQLRANVTPYDAVYVALAESLGCPLATTDGRLSRATGIRCPIIVVS